MDKSTVILEMHSIKVLKGPHGYYVSELQEEHLEAASPEQFALAKSYINTPELCPLFVGFVDPEELMIYLDETKPIVARDITGRVLEFHYDKVINRVVDQQYPDVVLESFTMDANSPLWFFASGLPIEKPGHGNSVLH
jgi:hypothetical protein